MGEGGGRGGWLRHPMANEDPFASHVSPAPPPLVAVVQVQACRVRDERLKATEVVPARESAIRVPAVGTPPAAEWPRRRESGLSYHQRKPPIWSQQVGSSPALNLTMTLYFILFKGDDNSVGAISMRQPWEYQACMGVPSMHTGSGTEQP